MRASTGSPEQLRFPGFPWKSNRSELVFQDSYRPDPRVLELGEGFYDEVEPARFPKHVLRFRNSRWAEGVGLGALTDEEWQRHFAELSPLPDNLPRALALRYHGHQFDVYNPALGDGRGFLLAQLRGSDGRLLDLGTKGSGKTPYSRGADGRLTLKGGVREVLATEMLEALGVSTSKSFSLFETGEELWRGDEPSPTRSSVLVRLGHSHVRIGTFQRFAQERDRERIQRLVDYSCRHLLGIEPDVPAFLSEVTRRSAELCASWMVAGFVHGVLNSDNMVVTGESFDYGPYRFLPHYDIDFVAAYFDEIGLYAFGRQPRAVAKNLQRLARSLELSDSTVDSFMSQFARARTARLFARLGLAPLEPDADALFADAVWTFLATTRMSYDQFFFDWYAGRASVARARNSPEAALYQRPEFEPVARGFETFAPARPEALAHPAFARERPPTIVIDEIERIWSRISESDDWSAFDAKIAEIRELGAALGQSL
jgi:uncharacterized protein YdiU (UPF0061 family)